jgi:hypothetical protein
VREITLPLLGDAGVGLLVHLGQSLALGAIAVLLTRSFETRARVRAALITVALWQLVAVVPGFSAIRADAAMNLSVVARIGLALLLIVALTFGTRGRATAPRFSREDVYLD